MTEFHLAQINIARLRFPLEAPETAEFVENLDPINALAEASPGFVWRLTGPDGASSSYVRLDDQDDPLDIVNYSVWQDFDSLKQFVFKTDHIGFLRRRTEWFEPADSAIAACWWIPVDSVSDAEPRLDEAHRRLEHLRANGSSDVAWTMNQPRPRPDAPVVF